MMETNYITLTKENIANEHICCAFSDKKCKDSYELKKEWLKKEFDNGYVLNGQKCLSNTVLLKKHGFR